MQSSVFQKSRFALQIFGGILFKANMNLVEINTAFEQQGWTEIVATLISKPLADEDLAVAIMGSPWHSSIKLGLFACIEGMSQFSDRLARDFSFYPFYRQNKQTEELIM